RGPPDSREPRAQLRTRYEPRARRRAAAPGFRPDTLWTYQSCSPNARRVNAPSRVLFVVLLVHPAPENPPAERTQPAKHVVHVTEIHQLDEVAVDILDEEEGMTPWRSFRLADALDALADQIVVPPRQVPHIERNVRQA